jgi:hypothetical protein
MNADSDSPVIAYSDGEVWSSVLHNAAIAEEHGGTALENARHIVRCANAHDDLINAAAALGDLLHALSVNEDKSRDAAMRKNLLIGARQRARAALAKVSSQVQP